MGEGFDCRCPNRNIKDIEGKSEPYEEVTIEIPTEARGSDWLGNGRSIDQYEGVRCASYIETDRFVGLGGGYYWH